MKLTKIIGSACALLQISASLAAEFAEPVQAPSRNIETNSAVYYKDRSIMPPILGVRTLLQSPIPSTNFLGLDGSDLVPETCGAVGRGDFVMTMLNTGASVQTHGGASLETNSLKGFWTSTNTS